MFVQVGGGGGGGGGGGSPVDIDCRIISDGDPHPMRTLVTAGAN